MNRVSLVVLSLAFVLAVLTFRLVPRYEVRVLGPSNSVLIRFDRWSGSVETTSLNASRRFTPTSWLRESGDPANGDVLLKALEKYRREQAPTSEPHDR
jgi:hypothetical protein